MSTIIDLENTYTSGVYSKRPVAIVRGSAALLWDDEGREYIDCVAGHGVASIGHGRSEVAAALAAQAQRIITCPEIVYNDVRARLLERLAQLTPEGLSRIFLCNSGTEAVEGAFKFARLATGRTGIVAALRSFHGRSLGALSATWEPHYREPFAPLLPGVTHVRYNNLDAAREAITEQTAAVIIELVQGEGGVHVATEEYVAGLAALCRERGALLIVDEVQTGFGRTGKLFACQHYNLQPDILCLAKALGGGVPMGAICLGPRVTESGRITRGAHGSTFGGNPLACAAALATLDILEHEALPARSAELGAYALARLRELNSPLIREVRGLGLMIGIELGRRVQPYLEKLCERGVLALPAGPNVLRLLPPLVISREQLDRVIEIIAELLVPAAANGTGSGNSSGRAMLNGNALAQGENAGSAASALAQQPESAAATATATLVRAEPSREVRLLQSMLTIPSYSGQESALAQYLVEQARALGLRSYVDEAGNFIASVGEEYEQAPIVLLGHMDTVRGNIPVRLEDDILYGRGAVDAKGPLAAFVCATARLAQSATLQRPIIIVGAVEEETVTSRGARAVVERYRPEACIIGEPSGSQAVTIGYKGCMIIEGSVTRQLSHTAAPLQSSNEIAVAFWERVRTHAEAWNQQHAGSSSFAALLPSLRAINSTHDGLEEQTSFTIGYRLPPDYDIAGLRAQLTDWAQTEDIQLSFMSREVAFQTTRAVPVARAFATAIRTTGKQATFKYKTGTSDMNVVGPVWGTNIVAYGPGDSRLDHTPQEHVRIGEYIHAIAVLELVLRRLAGQEDAA
ncbi:[LysW]-lysine hydrolase [Ktedonosporobacter rubrisoli]|uniref:Multifunctional fusion protein n=1 Tax=Ktedonosporobacter rubrisoli TaxID=2509675 RepID=A0A4V0Z011_KTERU|nr:[LysW]-lysine hydrolase [Ktedonosporobacter rubrisoli]QBD81601.1 [LysW]-lysine hydrolase [Ktedonosporobacter rubrisoli]